MSEHPSLLLPLALLTTAAAAYLSLAAANPRRLRPWPPARSALFVTGCALLLWGLCPQALPYPSGDLRKHMLQHLLLGMFAPIALVMAAPITLLLRTLPSRHGRRLTAILRSPALRLLANPLVALTLDLGAMAALYFTPLYTAAMLHPALHTLLHLHFIAAGCLYTWVIAGPDPAPHRPSVPARLVILGLAVVLHSVLAQLLYAGWHVTIPAPAPALQLQRAAELMYYGGDIAEMLLAFALVSSWHPAKKLPQRSPGPALTPEST